MQHQSHAPRKWSRVLLAALVLALLPMSVQLVSPRLAPRADAAGDLLCVGFSDCSAKGYSDSGYHQHWNHMYWLMYSGRNCVNYAAYRMVAAGMPDSRPWSGSGNAMNWGKAMSSITDTTPVVGAVAWWKAYAPGAGSLGHVAYVEKVVSPTEIIVSESNWGSDFDWRDITINGDWPSGFIHFRDKGVVNTAAPVIDGQPQVGATMRVSPGSWTPSANVKYQWMADGSPLKGQRSATYTPRPALLGRRISVKVTATAKNYRPASVTKTASAATGEGTITARTAPHFQTTSQPVVGQPVTVYSGLYTPSVYKPMRSVQWYADGTPIDGATDWSFTPTQAQVGQRLSATVTLKHAGYQDLVSDITPTKPVLAPLISLATPGQVTGTATRGGALTVDPGTFADPTTKAALDADLSYQWQRDGAPIPGATSASYHPTTDDVGHKLAVWVKAAHENYRAVSKRYVVPDVVTTASTLRVTVHAMVHAARVRVRLLAPGVATIDGPVTVTVGGQTMSGRLTNGVAVLGFAPLKSGNRRVSVSYAGTSVILASTAHTVVAVKAPVRKAHKAGQPVKKTKATTRK